MSLPIFYPRKAERITAPASEPVTLAELKSYLYIDHSDDDDLLNRMLQAAREAAEQFTRRSFITQTWKLTYDDNVPFHLDLPNGPVQSITSVVAEAEDTSTVTVNTQAYKLLSNDVLRVEGYVSAHKVHITYVTGYGDDAADVPAPIRQGIAQHVAVMLEGRQVLSELPGSAISLYAPYKKLAV